MSYVFDAFTISAMIISTCCIIAMLLILDCCKMRKNIKQIFKNI